MITYPLYVSSILLKRGLKKEAILLIVTSFIGLGCILTIKYRQKRPRITNMSLDEKCPECGYSNGYYEEKKIIIETGMEALSYGAIIFWSIWIVICLFISIIFLLFTIKNSQLLVLGIFLIVIFLAGTALGIKPLYKYFKSGRENVNEYYCGKCDNIWNKYYRR
jgi:hypothetical protein